MKRTRCSKGVFPDFGSEYALLQMQNPTSLKAESNAATISFSALARSIVGNAGCFTVTGISAGFTSR
jgi:hypothetical protein